MAMTPQQVGKLMKKGLTLTQISHLESAGFSFDQILTLTSAGLSFAQITDCMARGYTFTQMKQLASEMEPEKRSKSDELFKGPWTIVSNIPSLQGEDKAVLRGGAKLAEGLIRVSSKGVFNLVKFGIKKIRGS